LNRFSLLIVLCFFMTVSCRANSSSSQKGSEKKSEKTKVDEEKLIAAPEFTFEDTEGNKHTLSSYKGKVVLINFWVVNCPACRAEISYLMKLYDEYKDEELVILGVGIGKKDYLKAFSKYFNINYPILLGDMETAMKYSILAVPTTFIMDRKGELTDTIIGYNKIIGKKMEKTLQELLKEEEKEESEK
jgi:cytochrome c-type biogenesis protein